MFIIINVLVIFNPTF